MPWCVPCKSTAVCLVLLARAHSSCSRGRAASALLPYGTDARGGPLAAAPPPECTLVIDAGFSFTHVVPILRGAIVSYAAKRCVKWTVVLSCA